jgi:site-specific recombinase XerD
MTNPLLVGPWVRRFLLEHVVAERNLTPNTQHSYRDTFRLLLPFAAQQCHHLVEHLKLEDLSASLLQGFLRHLSEKRHCGPATLNQRLAALRAWAHFVGLRSPEHVAWSGQIHGLPFKKVPRPLVPYLEKVEMQVLLNTPNLRHPQGQRDQALLLFLYNTGARATEAIQVKIGDLDWSLASVVLHGKSRKDRCCPLWPKTVTVLQKLVGQRIPTDPVFLNCNRHPLTRFGLHTLVERYAAIASQTVPSLRSKRVSPHSIRHTCAMHLLQAGVDINTIRAWLGHVSLQTTHIYAESDLEMKAKALAKCQVKLDSSKGWSSSQGPTMAFLHSI